MAKTPPVKKEKVAPTVLEKAEAEEKRLADEAEAEEKRLADEAEEKRLADEAEEKRLADEAEEKRLADEAEEAEADETDLPDAIDVIHKHSEKEFTVSRAYYLANKGNLRLA